MTLTLHSMDRARIAEYLGPSMAHWIAEDSPGSWWIYDIEMVESQRGKGYGRAKVV